MVKYNTLEIFGFLPGHVVDMDGPRIAVSGIVADGVSRTIEDGCVVCEQKI
jgi:hypothetical protein